MKIRPVGAQLLHANGETDKTDGHNKANIRFSQFCEHNTPDIKLFPTHLTAGTYTEENSIFTM